MAGRKIALFQVTGAASTTWKRLLFDVDPYSALMMPTVEKAAFGVSLFLPILLTPNG